MAAEVYELIVTGVLGGQFVENVFHALSDGAAAADPFEEARQLVNKVNGAAGWLEKWGNMLPDSYLIKALKSRRVKPVGASTAFINTAGLTTSAGQRSGDISTMVEGPLLLWFNATSPKRVGKTFAPGVSQSDVTAGVLSLSLITEVSAFISFVLTPFTTANGDAWEWGHLGTPSNTFYPWIHGTDSLVLGTQRRRERPT